MTKFSDESLMLYADGLLDAPERERLQQALMQDERLRDRLKAFHSTGKDLAALFELHAASPLPPRLREIVDGIAQATGPVPVTALGKRAQGPVWRDSWRSEAALAASLAMLAGIGLGWLLHVGLGGNSEVAVQDMVRADGGSLIAGAALRSALESQPSGAKPAGAQGGVSVKMTFQNAAGDYCRQYGIVAQQSLQYAGIACRTDGVWRVGFQAQVPPAPSAANHTVPASGGSDIMDAAVGAVIAGDPLSGADEAALLNRRWAK